MAATIISAHISIDSSDSFQTPGTGRRAVLNRLAKLLEGLNSGAYAGTQVAYQTAGVKATGTFTSTDAVATDAISINGATFTAVASGATGDQWNIGADDAADCVNLAAAINASATALVSNHVTASAANNVVTITAKVPGHAGNAITIASADGTIVASGARLTSGAGTLTTVSI